MNGTFFRTAAVLIFLSAFAFSPRGQAFAAEPLPLAPEQYRSLEPNPPVVITRIYPPVPEDPAWYYQQSIQNLPKQLRENTKETSLSMVSRYPEMLEEALSGNPLAMTELVRQYQYSTDLIIKAFPDFPAFMHSEEYWRKWAARYTSPGWPYAREVDAWGVEARRSRELTLKGAELGDPESMTRAAATVGSAPWFTAMAADAGWGPAEQQLAARYRTDRLLGRGALEGCAGTESPGGSENREALERQDEERRYLTAAMAHGNAEAFANAAFDAFTGFRGNTSAASAPRTETDIETGYAYCKVAAVLSQPHSGLRLMRQGLPESLLQPLTKDGVVTCALRAWPQSYADSSSLLKLKEQYRVTLAADPALALTPQQEARATKQASAILLALKVRLEAALTPEHPRRLALTKELREELAPVAAYFEAKKKAREELERLKQQEKEKYLLFERWKMPVLYALGVLLVLLVGLYLWLRRGKSPQGWNG